MTTDSSWVRYPRTYNGVRGCADSRLSLSKESVGWVVLLEGKTYQLSVPHETSLEDAILHTDAEFPPEGWTYTPKRKRWHRDGWEVCSEKDGWGLLRENPEDGSKAAPTKQVFQSPDRARKWAELRLDRTNLRGPRPRAEGKSTKTLPDVRVTPSERLEAVGLADSLGVSYSELARTLLRFARDHIVQNKTFALVRTVEDKTLILAPRQALAVRDDGNGYDLFHSGTILHVRACKATDFPDRQL